MHVSHLSSITVSRISSEAVDSPATHVVLLSAQLEGAVPHDHSPALTQLLSRLQVHEWVLQQREVQTEPMVSVPLPSTHGQGMFAQHGTHYFMAHQNPVSFNAKGKVFGMHRHATIHTFVHLIHMDSWYDLVVL
jgi:hypothetical protein